MTRVCGDCQLCCRLLPVRSVNKAAGEKCPHQRHHKGCAVYKHLEDVSPECRIWTCRWLVEDDTAAMRRPDRAGYVIDVMPEYVTVRADGEPTRHIQCVQVWADDKRPNAWREDADLRLYMERQARRGICTLVRYNANKHAIAIFPPAFDAGGQWHEFDNPVRGEEHGILDVISKLGPVKIVMGP